MFKRHRVQIFLAVALVGASAVLYFLHYRLFHDIHHIAIFFVEDVAFIPIEVLIVTLIIHRALHSHEKRQLMQKLNMAIGTFFSHLGNDLLRLLRGFDASPEELARRLDFSNVQTVRDIDKLRQDLEGWDTVMAPLKGDLAGLRNFLDARLDFLMGLLENPHLLEHDRFTDLLWAVFHVADELRHRDDFSNLPQEDVDHLAGDLHRAYRLAVVQWLEYMKHLKSDYPYLYSLAVRLNPFDPQAGAVIGEQT